MKTLDADMLLKQLPLEQINNRDDIIIVDVRESNEYIDEHIAKATNIPLTRINELKEKENEYKNKTAIFYCRSGNRTKVHAQLLEDSPFKEKYCIGGGIVQWKASNLPTESHQISPIDIMRHIQLIAGIIVLLGLDLGIWISSYFLLLTMIAGIVLLITGLASSYEITDVLKSLSHSKPKHH